MHEPIVNESVNAVVAHLSGEVDVNDAAPLILQLTGAVRRTEPDVLAVDLAKVTFIDSSGLDALVAVRNACTSTGTAFQVTGVAPKIARVITIGGLAQAFGVPPVSATRGSDVAEL